jgi:hypothetical protein
MGKVLMVKENVPLTRVSDGVIERRVTMVWELMDDGKICIKVDGTNEVIGFVEQEEYTKTLLQAASQNLKSAILEKEFAMMSEAKFNEILDAYPDEETRRRLLELRQLVLHKINNGIPLLIDQINREEY